MSVLDTRGLLCPLPVIRTQDHAKTLAAGTVIEVWATDIGALHDIPAWCRVHGHRVLAITDANCTSLDPSTLPNPPPLEVRIHVEIGDGDN